MPQRVPPPDGRPTPIEHYENFPVASVLCPPRLRRPISAIYHFARCADDIADEGQASAQQRLSDLHALGQELYQPGSSDPRWHSVMQPLHTAIDQYQLPQLELQKLLEAFIQDVEHSRDAAWYDTDSQVLDYCGRSANPIGRLLLHLYGIRQAEALAQSDAICTALQLINFWQDLGVDISRGRFYLSLEALNRFGVDRAELLALHNSAATRALIGDCVRQARAMMQHAAPLVHTVGGRAGWELRLVIHGGLRILEKIERMQFESLTRRVTLRWWDVPVLLWRSLWM
jgi:squalene synthase HpnC